MLKPPKTLFLYISYYIFSTHNKHCFLVLVFPEFFLWGLQLFLGLPSLSRITSASTHCLSYNKWILRHMLSLILTFRSYSRQSYISYFSRIFLTHRWIFQVFYVLVHWLTCFDSSHRLKHRKYMQMHRERRHYISISSLPYNIRDREQSTIPGHWNTSFHQKRKGTEIYRSVWGRKHGLLLENIRNGVCHLISYWKHVMHTWTTAQTTSNTGDNDNKLIGIYKRTRRENTWIQHAPEEVDREVAKTKSGNHHIHTHIISYITVNSDN